ncbi:MAG TPA: gamma carbonic anhydrase family protein [Solirubrobacterales bacterium]|nr:gamma carbonic anhydrase family protein [Solirubrobacterales bacterium]
MAIERLGDLVPRIDETAWVHPDATLIGDVEVGPECSVWPQAVLRADLGPIRIGVATSVQDGVVIHSGRIGVFVGARCIVGHLAFLEDATVEDACQVGVGSRILNGTQVGAGSVIAAGAILVQALQVPPGSRVQGVPARVLPGGRPTREEIEAGAAHYADEARRYAAEWKRLA